MKVLAVLSSLALTLILGAWEIRGSTGKDSIAGADGRQRAPVLVELFTSEGCSSCPPADALLQKLDAEQPVPGAEAIVLSEHVDYWNHQGWRDPFSSGFYSDRQSAYAQRFGLGSVYTPQMVIDGNAEMVGSRDRLVAAAIVQSASAPKVPIRIVSISRDRADTVTIYLESDPLRGSAASMAELYAAIAENHVSSQVTRGENSGRDLSHVAVVRNLDRVGKIDKQKGFSADVRVNLPRGSNPENLRLIVFLQEPHQGRVLGSAMKQVPPGTKQTQ